MQHIFRKKNSVVNSLWRTGKESKRRMVTVALESAIPAGNCGAGAECIFLAWMSGRGSLDVVEGEQVAIWECPGRPKRLVAIWNSWRRVEYFRWSSWDWEKGSISGKRDLLITTEMVSVNADAYRAADNGESVITEVVIGISGHHLMLDVAREECAEMIMNWLKGLVV